MTRDFPQTLFKLRLSVTKVVLSLWQEEWIEKSIRGRKDLVFCFICSQDVITVHFYIYRQGEDHTVPHGLQTKDDVKNLDPRTSSLSVTTIVSKEPEINI